MPTQPDRSKLFNKKYWEAIQKDIVKGGHNKPRRDIKLGGEWKPLKVEPQVPNVRQLKKK